MISGIGKTHFQGGSAEDIYNHSLQNEHTISCEEQEVCSVINENVNNCFSLIWRKGGYTSRVNLGICQIFERSAQKIQYY